MKKALLLALLALAGASPATADAPGVGGLALMPVLTYPHELKRCANHNPEALFQGRLVRVRDRIGRPLKEMAVSRKRAVAICMFNRDYMGLHQFD